jgi:hypothetical protein
LFWKPQGFKFLPSPSYGKAQPSPKMDFYSLKFRNKIPSWSLVLEAFLLGTSILELGAFSLGASKKSNVFSGQCLSWRMIRAKIKENFKSFWATGSF